MISPSPSEWADLGKIWRREPLKCQAMLWPQVSFYKKQRETIESVVDSAETYVVAGNQLGKDFVAGFIVLWFFLAHYRLDKKSKRNWVRVVTTSVKDEHLDVLWAEIGGYVVASQFPLSHKHGGPLVLNTHEIRHVSELEATGGNVSSYIKGQVSKEGEGLAGHHAVNTLFVGDEASGIKDVAYKMAQGWAKRMLIFGNPNPCVNFFYRGVKAGNLEVPAT